MNFRKILSILFFVSVFCSHAQAVKRQPEDQLDSERDSSKKSRRDVESNLPGAVVDDGPESSDDETGSEVWQTAPEEIVGGCDAEVCDLPHLPIEILCDDIMPSLDLHDALNLCSTDYCLRMTCLPPVLQWIISNETLNPKQLCNCLEVFSYYLRRAQSFPENERCCLVAAAIAPYAIQAAKQYFMHKDESIRAAALNLFRILFQHGLGFAETLAEAQQNINHMNLWVRGRALDLFRTLVVNIQHCPEQLRAEIIAYATQAAQQNINHMSLWVIEAAASLMGHIQKITQQQ